MANVNTLDDFLCQVVHIWVFIISWREFLDGRGHYLYNKLAVKSISQLSSSWGAYLGKAHLGFFMCSAAEFK
jgi:hypothetical protein